MGVGAGVPTTFWSVSGPVDKGGFILEWALEVGNTTNPPLVTSISYGDWEVAYFNKFGSWDYINRMDVELAKMASRGLTVFAGSGDAGVSNVGEDGNDLSPPDATCTPFRPFYPSSSMYVVSVSSTFLTTNALPMCSDAITSPDPYIPLNCDQVREPSRVCA
jgi:subtilase family serine protease